MVQVIVVGVGQKTNRPAHPDEFVHPIDAMAEVVRRAAQDAGQPALLQKADALHIVNMLSYMAKDAPTALAEKLGCQPAIKEYTAVGGNTPQWLVHRAADNFASGKSKIAILAGCEVMHSLRMASKMGVDLGAFREGIEIPLVGTQRNGTIPVESDHGADLPVRIYPLLEIALRAKEGLSVEKHRARLGRWGETFSNVAAQNPHSWNQTPRSADEIITVTDKNRMLGYPYTRLLNSELYVDQAAAIILTTPETARELAIPEERWVYVHGGQDAHDEWHISHRQDLASSPAIKACVDDALAQAQCSLNDIDFFDLYSCFSVMPFLYQHMLQIPDDDPRPRTLTGGLPFFGGPGNNYTMHAIAEAVDRCRANPKQLGLVTGNGYYVTKHAVGIFGSQPPKGPWKRTSPEDFQQQLELPRPVEVDLEPAGKLTIEAYTVWHDRQGQPEYSVLCGRTETGKRAWGRTENDPSVLQQLISQEAVGRSARVLRRDGNINIVELTG